MILFFFIIRKSAIKFLFHYKNKCYKISFKYCLSHIQQILMYDVLICIHTKIILISFTLTSLFRVCYLIWKYLEIYHRSLYFWFLNYSLVVTVHTFSNSNILKYIKFSFMAQHMVYVGKFSECTGKVWIFSVVV